MWASMTPMSTVPPLNCTLAITSRLAMVPFPQVRYVCDTMVSTKMAVLTWSCSTLHWMSSCGVTARAVLEKRMPRRANERKEKRIMF